MNLAQSTLIVELTELSSKRQLNIVIMNNRRKPASDERILRGERNEKVRRHAREREC